MKFPTIKQPVRFKEIEVPHTIINGKTHFSRLTLEEFGITDWPVKYNMDYDPYTDTYFYPPNSPTRKELLMQKWAEVVKLQLSSKSDNANQNDHCMTIKQFREKYAEHYNALAYNKPSDDKETV